MDFEVDNTGMDMSEFLGHTTRGGGGVDFLENWKKKRTPPQIDTFLHPGARIIAVWQHPWPKMVERTDDKGNESIEVWSGTFNSWETESLLKKQYHREPKGVGERVAFPQICPMSLMIEAVHELVRDGELNWCDEVFRFEGTDASKAKVLHAGGLYNQFGSKAVKESKALQAEMKAAGIFASKAWQENMMAKCNYIFCIVDNDNPGLGAQVTTEKTLLGDKVKALINDEITSAKTKQDPAGRLGNPIANPYCIRWVHRPNEQAFGDKYKALVMRNVKVEDEVQAAFDADPPETAHLARRGNIKKLRDSMESAYVGPEGMLDFGAIFAPSERKYAEDQGTDEDVDDMVEATKAARPTRSRSQVKAKEPEPEPEDESEDGDAVEAAKEAQAAADKKVQAKEKRAARKAAKEKKEREEEILAMEDLSEGDLLTLLDEDLTDSLRENLQSQLDAIQAKAEPVEPEEPAAEVDADDEEVECDVCKEPMLLSADTCPHCGAKYDDDGLVEEKPKPTRSRSAAKAGKTGGNAKDKINF